MNVARTGGASSSHNPNDVPPMVHNQHHHNDPAAPSQQQPPPLVGVGRVPAPLPTARTKIRAAPPPNRIEAIPRNPTIQPSPMTASSASSRQPYTTSAQSLPRQQAQQTPNPIMAATDHSSNSSRSSVQGSLTQAEQEKKEKERFFMFIRVLMKYLEQQDAEMHSRAKAEIKECYERNKSGDPAYKCLTQSMKDRLQKTVRDEDWKKAQNSIWNIS